MFKSLLFTIISTFIFKSAFAVNTVTYIVSFGDRTLIKVDENGLEHTIKLPKDPEVIVTKGERAYMLTSTYTSDPIRPASPNGIKRTLSAMDLESLSVSGEVELQHEPVALVLTDQHAYVAHFSGASVSVHDLQDLTKTEEIKVGQLPISLEIRKGLLYVLCQESKSLHVINKETLKTLHKLDLGSTPKGFCFTESMGYILNTDNSVTVLDLKDHQVINCISVGKKPSSMVLTADHLVVANEEDNTITALSLVDHKVSTVQKVGRKPIKMAADDHFIYVLNQQDATVSIHQRQTLRLVALQVLDFKPSELDLTNTHIYVDGQRAFPKYPIPEQIQHILRQHQLSDYAMNTKLFEGMRDVQIIRRNPDGTLEKPLTDQVALDRIIQPLFPQSVLCHDSEKGQHKLLTALSIYLYTGQTHYARVTLRGLIELGNPYACALGVLAYKHDLWGAKGNSALATLLKTKADTRTIERFERTMPGFYESLQPYLTHTLQVIKDIVVGT